MHIDEHLLEQYLLNPRLLSSDQRARIERSLKTCRTSRAIFEYLRAYYSELEHTSPCMPVVYDYFTVPGRN